MPRTGWRGWSRCRTGRSCSLCTRVPSRAQTGLSYIHHTASTPTGLYQPFPLHKQHKRWPVEEHTGLSSSLHTVTPAASHRLRARAHTRHTATLLAPPQFRLGTPRTWLPWWRPTRSRLDQPGNACTVLPQRAPTRLCRTECRHRPRAAARNARQSSAHTPRPPAPPRTALERTRSKIAPRRLQCARWRGRGRRHRSWWRPPSARSTCARAGNLGTRLGIGVALRTPQPRRACTPARAFPSSTS
jgi:hypothetical protein